MTNSFQLDTYIEHLSSLVNVDCGSHTPEGVAKIADILTPMFESIGFSVKRHTVAPNAGPCLEITNKPDAEQFDVMLCGHMDTVFPEVRLQSARLPLMKRRSTAQVQRI